MAKTEKLGKEIPPMTRLTELRDKKGWTRQDLAWEIRTNASAVKAWEEGLHAPTFKTLQKLAKALDCDINDLLAEPIEEADADDMDAAEPDNSSEAAQ